MQRTDTRALVESGFLTAGLVVLAFLMMLVPGLMMFSVFLWPLPITVIGVRHGPKWSILATIVGAVISSLFLGPMTAFSEALVLSTGIVLGMSYYYNWGNLKRFFAGSAMLSIAFVIMLLMYFFVMKIDIIDVQQKLYLASVDAAIATAQAKGVGADQLVQMKAAVEESFKLVRLVLLSTLLLWSMVSTYVNCILAEIILRRTGIQVERFTPIARWEIPRWIGYLFVLSWISIYWGNTRSIEVLRVVGMNAAGLATFGLWLQGLAVFAYLADGLNLSRSSRIMIFALTLLAPMLQNMMVGAGIFDMVTNYRKKRNYLP